MSLERYFPMAVGRAWRYRFLFMGQNAGEVRQEVQATRQSQRSSVWRMIRYISGAEPEPVPVVMTADTVRVSSAEVLRGPLEVGAHWTDSGEDGIRVYEVARMHFTEEVPAGRYEDCVEIVAYRGGVEVQRTVFAPGAGMIRHHAFVPGGTMELQLLEMTDPNRH
jgi:hypothetical protein